MYIIQSHGVFFTIKSISRNVHFGLKNKVYLKHIHGALCLHNPSVTHSVNII